MQEFKKKIHGSRTTTLIISNKEMNDIMKIVQALEDSNIVLKEVTKNETKEQKGGFLSMLLGALGASLLENVLTGRGIKVDFESKKRKGIVRAGMVVLRPLLRKIKWIFNVASSFNKL